MAAADEANPVRVWRVLAGCAALALACSTAPPKDLPQPPAEPIDACHGAAGAEEVTVRYLRAGGFVIRFRDEALLTAPFYSNPSFIWAGLGLPIGPKPDRIPARPDLLANATVAGVLVGHAHYDHLMDVPAVLEAWQLPNVPVYGDETAKQLLSNRKWPGTAYPVNAAGGSWFRRGEWMHPPAAPGALPPHPRFRVMPLLSEHAPHAPGVKLFQGHVGPREDEPRNAYDWKEGQTWGFLIDVLTDDGARVLLRIHYQDSASNPELGWPPEELLAERSVDLVLFCAASFALVREHPQAILRALAPRHAMAAHWEDFSSKPRDDGVPRVVALTSMPELLARLRGALPARHYSVPKPGAEVRFRVCGARP